MAYFVERKETAVFTKGARESVIIEKDTTGEYFVLCIFSVKNINALNELEQAKLAYLTIDNFCMLY